jgi:hypothetical protein
MIRFGGVGELFGLPSFQVREWRLVSTTEERLKVSDAPEEARS